MDEAIRDKIPWSVAFGNHLSEIPFFMEIIFNFAEPAEIDNEDNQPKM